MHWTDAIKKSPKGECFRVKKDGNKVFRRSDGSGYIWPLTLSSPRPAEPFELNGYLDWEPVS